jgi:adenylate cyclase
VPEAAANASGEKKPISGVSHKDAIPVEKKDSALPDRPSIAVLPFVSMSDDPKQEYFSDGLTENIIAGLSVERRLLVIARNSTFVYKGKSVDIQEVGRKLGVQYVVEGSVQKTQDRVRVTAQLIDANTGHHVWADRYDRDLKDIFALQDEITMRIMTGVGMKIIRGEHYRYGEEFLPPSGNVDVVMKLMKVYEYFHHRPNKEGNILARKELEEAIALEPEFSKLYATLAWTHLGDLLYQSSESPENSFAQASKNIQKALALDNEDWFAHYLSSWLNLFRKEHDKAISAAQSAIALNPNAADAYWMLGFALIMSGRTEEGIRLIEKAMRLHPMPPDHYLMDVGFGYYFLGRHEDAIEIHSELLKRTPDRFGVHLYLTATYSASGREEEARRQAEELLRLDPSFSLDRIAELFPIKDEAKLEQFITNLRKAGLK